MVYLPLHMLKPNMELAKSIPSSNLYLPLMVAGQYLTPESIANMEARGIQGAYIESALSDGLEIDELIEPGLKYEILTGIHSEFDRCLYKNTDPNYRAFTVMAENIVMSILKKDTLLFNVIAIRDYDNYTYSHSLYVGIVSVLIGVNLHFPTSVLTELATAGLLHDIGKLDIPLTIINKPGPLTPAEFDIMRQHPSCAVNRLTGIPPYRSPILRGIESHHERYDGTGYPLGLSAGSIPIFGRILAIADVYDALSSTRAYRKAWPPNQIIEYIISRSGTHFDPDLLPAFLHSVAAYPVGTMVRLSNGYVGIVTSNNPDFILRPAVRILYPPDQCRTEIDLAHSHFSITVLDTLADNEDNFAF